MTLSFGRYVAVEPVGSGPDGADGARDGWHHVRWWRGRCIATQERVLVGVLPLRHADAVRNAVDRAADVEHDHLLPLLDVVDGAADIGMVLRWPGEESLQSLLHRRGTLRAGEMTTILAPVAAALAAVHAADLVYGSVGSATIWLDDTGRPVMLPLAPALLERELDGSLPGTVGDLSPEVARDKHVTAASDVFSLGSVLLHCLTGEPAWPAEDAADVLVQSAAGLWPDAPDDAGPPELVALLRRMLAAEPGGRPPAAAILARLAATAPAIPVDMREASTRLAATTDQDDAAAKARGEVEADSDDDADSDDESPARPVSGWRGRRRAEVPRRRVVGIAVGVVAAALLAVAAAQTGLWWARSDEDAAAPVAMTLAPTVAASDRSDANSPAVDGAGGTDSADETDWHAVVSELDGRRARAFVGRDPALLDAVYTVGASARDADAAAIARLVAAGIEVRGATHVITSVEQIRDRPPGAPGEVRLRVVDALPAHVLTDSGGTTIGETPARAPSARILRLTLQDSEYRIVAVEEP